MPITVELRQRKAEEQLIPGGPMTTVFHQTLHDVVTGRHIDSAETIALFEKDEIIGVFVQMKSKWLAVGGLDGRPAHGIITDITDSSIIVGDEGIPKTLFHEWYELD